MKIKQRKEDKTCLEAKEAKEAKESQKNQIHIKIVSITCSINNIEWNKSGG